MFKVSAEKISVCIAAIFLVGIFLRSRWRNHKSTEMATYQLGNTHLKTNLRKKLKIGEILKCCDSLSIEHYKLELEQLFKNDNPDYAMRPYTQHEHGSKNDILIVSNHRNCAQFDNFAGIILHINFEPPLPYLCKPQPNVYWLGPWYVTGGSEESILMTQHFGRTIPMFLLSFVYSNMILWYPHMFMDNIPQRISNDYTSRKFAIYASTNCVNYRDTAYRLINSIGDDRVHIGGSCPVRHVRPPTISPWKTPRRTYIDNIPVYSHYRFVLCMENTKSIGYVTEKILYAFMSGAIPIYYGSNDIFNIFNKDAFIWFDPIEHVTETLRKIKYLNENRSAYLEMVARPMLKEGSKTVQKYLSIYDGPFKNIKDIIGVI